MGGDHHYPLGKGPTDSTPDYRIYKVCRQNTPLLYKLETLLAEKGLKDPWIRNEVWKYDVRKFGTENQRWWKLVTFGGTAKYGVILFAVAVAGDQVYRRMIKYHHNEHLPKHATSYIEERDGIHLKHGQ